MALKEVHPEVANPGKLLPGLSSAARFVQEKEQKALALPARLTPVFSKYFLPVIE